MSRKSIVVSEKKERLKRAEFCTEYLQTFENSVKNWADLAEVLIEVERDELFLDMGVPNLDEWFDKVAPVSKRLCYAIKGRYRALRDAGLTHSETKMLSRETAEWASKARNISPAALMNPEIKAALLLPKQKAIKIIQEIAPHEHVEDSLKIVCKFAVSQGKIVQDAYEVFKKYRDETASFPDFVEFLASEFILSLAETVK